MNIIKCFVFSHFTLKSYSALLVTSYCALRRFCTSRKGGKGGGGWGHPQGVVHMAAARLGCKRAMVGTEWAMPWLHEQT